VAILFIASCQTPIEGDSNLSSITVVDAPASDSAASLDFSKLPDGFPILAEMVLPEAPKNCGLSKLTRADTSTSDTNLHYVFSSQSDEDGLYHIGINQLVRTLKQYDAADMGTKKIRYFKTVDAPEVEIQLVLESEGSTQKSTLSRVKAWDADLPLVCAYNMIEVVGHCDL